MATLNLDSKTYLMVLPVQYHRIDEHTVALESAFSEHLKLLKAKCIPVFNQFIVGMAEMGSENYDRTKNGLAILDERESGIIFKSLYKNEEASSQISRFILLFKLSFRLKNLIKNCDLLHTGLSSNFWFPMEFIATLWGSFLRKPIIYVVDIDFRNSAKMMYKTGRLSTKSYLLCKYIYDKFKEIQIKFSVKKCSLVLLKGEKLCRDFGKGKPHVKNFLDAAHSEHHIINKDALEKKLLHIRDYSRPLEIVYFGRLTSYKGIDLCIRAISMAHQKMDCNVIFHIIGSGEQAEILKELTKELSMEERVIFHGVLPFNQEFFKKLYTYHLLLAAPLSEDTPRSALDAMAAGIPILAFDTYYYKDLESTGAVNTVDWLSIEQLSEKIAYYSNNREILAKMVVNAIDFARQNTQEKWLDTRFDWTLNLVSLRSK